MQFWPNGLFFSGDDRDIVKEEFKTYLNATNTTKPAS
jgi:hypothetical protein